jgi:chitinase
MIPYKPLAVALGIAAAFSLSNAFAYSTKAPFKTTNGKQIFGYYTNWDTYDRKYQPADIPIDDVTAIMYAFAQVGNCAPPYASDNNPTVCHEGAYATGKQDYLLHSTDPGSDFLVIPQGYKHAGDTGSWVKGNIGKVINLAHKQQKPVLLSILGYSLSVPFHTAIDDQHRKAFTDSILNFLKLVKDDNQEDGFDGVDVDWEPNDNQWSFVDGPNGTQELKNYLTFLQDLRKELKDNYANYAWLTIALPASPHIIQKVDQLVPGYWKDIAATVDYMDIMSYDYHGAFDNPKYTNFLAPLKYDAEQPQNIANRDVFNINATLAAYSTAQVPMHKVILGIPAYGRAVKGVDSDLAHNVRVPEYPGLYQKFTGTWKGQWDDTGTYDYYEVKNDLLKNGFTEYHYPKAGESYAYNPSLDGGVFISYDNLQDVDTKINLVNSDKLAGVMYWSLSGDIHKDMSNFASDSLIHNTFKAFAKLKPHRANIKKQ